ncbi:FGGY family carbohydrate kinase [Lentzea sp. NPDC058450]|uniref:FGGY family carbohydrate kinase n=1 Tax=Lentzea sp. NPDC058450 TaxID=3346505 RepID=UPI00364A54E2
MDLLGIDVGTSIAKAVLFDDTGEVIRSASRPITLLHPERGHVEQDVDELMREVRSAIAEVTACAAPSLVAVTGQGDGCWLVDDRGRPVRTAISWMDARGAGIVDDWSQDGTAAKIYSINGNAVFSGSMAPVLAWLDRHEPGTLDRATTAAHCKDVVFGQLTGLRATDNSDASLPFGVPEGGSYSADVLRLAGLAHRADLLAPVVTPLPIAPNRTDLLPASAVVTSGPFDLPACAVGGGVDQPGDGLLIIGTTLGCQVLTERLDTSGAPSGMHVTTAEPGRWMRVMAAMSGCSALDWVRDLTGLRQTSLDAVLGASPPGSAGVEVLPYLAPSGERAPFLDQRASGQFTGVRLTTTPADLVRATCEGLAYTARECFEAAGLRGRVVVCGGGARSRAWLEIFASVLGRPLHVARSPEVGARGAVLAALQATGADHDRTAWTRPESVVDPVPELVRRYEDGYLRFLRHRETARSTA